MTYTITYKYRYEVNGVSDQVATTCIAADSADEAERIFEQQYSDCEIVGVI